MDTTDTARSERSPFMELPPEIRLMIYNFAIQDTIAVALSIPAMRAGEYTGFRRAIKPYVGAMALLHTNNIIRQESSDAMQPIVTRQCEVLEAHHWSVTMKPASLKTSEAKIHRIIDASHKKNSIENIKVALVNVALTKAGLPRLEFI